MHRLWAFTYNFSIRVLPIAYSWALYLLLPLVSLCGTASYLVLQQQATHSLSFSVANVLSHSKYANSVSAPKVRQDRYQSGRQLSEKPGHWMYIPFFFFPLRRKSWDGMLSSGTVLCCAGLRKKLTWVKWKLFFLFQCNYSQLCTHLGVLQPLNWILEIS